MEPGRIVEYIQEGKVHTGLCLEVKKGRLRVLSENDRELELSQSRIIHTSSYILDVTKPRFELIKLLKEIITRREALMSQVRISDLWDILKDESSPFEARDLAELWFQEREVSSDHESAILRAVLSERVYFRFRDDLIHPNSPERVEKILLQMKMEEERERTVDLGAKWIRSIIMGHPVDEPEGKEEIINLLKEIALFGKEAPQWKRAKDLLQRAGINDINKVFSILVRMGVWDENENLYLHKYGIPVEFPQSVMEEAVSLVSHKRPSYPTEGVEDLRDLEVLTIDSPSTLDVDDGISIEKTEEGLLLGIHITDVARFILPGTSIDIEAMKRGTSIYLPEGRIPMLPFSISEGLCSLEQGKERYCLSIFCKIDREGNVLSSDICEGLINVRRRFSYDDVDEIVGKGGALKELFEIMCKFREKRVAMGALLLPIPEIMVRVKEGGEIEIERRDREGPAQILVSEAMILANWISARFLSIKGIPSIFKSQMAPKERLQDAGKGGLFLNYRQRRLLSRADTSTDPSPHSGLGLEVYTNVTSPLRRYIDLIVQRQIKDSLRGGKGLYTKEELDEIAVKIEEVTHQKGVMEQMRKRYWILKYLEGRQGMKTKALVLDQFQNRTLILLTDFLLETTIPCGIAKSWEIGEEMEVKIKKISAHEDLLRVEPC